MNYANVNFSNNKGVPLVMECPRSKAAKSITQLAGQLEKPGSVAAVELPEQESKYDLKSIAAQYL